MRVYCLPHAGAGAGLYRRQRATAKLDLHPIQLPGREERINEPAWHTVAEAAGDCAEQIAATLSPATPYALFGHSFGAHVAFETARSLTSRGWAPHQLVLSGAAAPHLPRVRAVVAGLSDDDLLARLCQLIDYDHPALHHVELRQLLVPTLRADLHAQDDYRPGIDPRLDIPITVLHGTDDTMVRTEQAHAWAELTAGAFEFVPMAGGHMWLIDNWQLLWQTIGRSVDLHQQ
jgi:surfactin synthase thioesterase subunit